MFRKRQEYVLFYKSGFFLNGQEDSDCLSINSSKSHDVVSKPEV